MVVVAGQEQEIDERRGYSPAKPKTECPALGIGLVSKRPAGSVVGTCKVRKKWSLKSWEPGMERTSEGRRAAQKQWILSACTQYPPGGYNGCGEGGGGAWGGVYTSVRVVSSV